MRSHQSILLTIFSMIFIWGCTAKPPVTDPFSVAPNDFSLDITVITTEAHSLAHMRSSRFVVFPNGALHHGDEDGWGPNTLPARTRLLSREQIAIIWNRLDQMGMSSPKRADETVNFQLLPKPKDGSVYMIAVNGDGEYWNFIRYISEDQQADPAFKNLIRLLANYAWSTDEPDVEGYEEPIRYDMGGNPYARYEEDELP
jgi:hypothetical protein